MGNLYRIRYTVKGEYIRKLPGLLSEHILEETASDYRYLRGGGVGLAKSAHPFGYPGMDGEAHETKVDDCAVWYYSMKNVIYETYQFDFARSLPAGCTLMVEGCDVEVWSAGEILLFSTGPDAALLGRAVVDAWALIGTCVGRERYMYDDEFREAVEAADSGVCVPCSPSQPTWDAGRKQEFGWWRNVAVDVPSIKPDDMSWAQYYDEARKLCTYDRF